MYHLARDSVGTVRNILPEQHWLSVSVFILRVCEAKVAHVKCLAVSRCYLSLRVLAVAPRASLVAASLVQMQAGRCPSASAEGIVGWAGSVRRQHMARAQLFEYWVEANAGKTRHPRVGPAGRVRWCGGARTTVRSGSWKGATH